MDNFKKDNIDERSQYFEWIMEEYNGNIYISDMDTYELLYLNKNALKTLGNNPEKLLGRKCYEVIQGRKTPCPFCTNDKLTKDKFYEWEFYNTVLGRNFVIKDREIDWYGHRARLELSHDMYSTEYKLAKKDQERDILLSTFPGGFCRLDANNLKKVLWFTDEFLNLIGYTKKQFEEELNCECVYVHNKDFSRLTELASEAIKTGEKIVTEIRIKTRSGDMKILTATLAYVSAEKSWDGIPSFYSIGIDITKAREEELRQRNALEDAYSALKIANSAKTEFLSAMSHDIRTPMNAIVGMTALAQANINSVEKVKDCLNKINVSSRHLLNLINEVLDMSKIESGKIDLVLKDIELSQLIENVLDMCKPLMKEKGHKFRVVLGQLQHEKLILDGDRLQQVIMNLLSNAIKYTPDGGVIELTINELPSLFPQKGWYEFIIKDNGIGISEDFIPKLFEPFSRAEDSRISKIQGTGLGMAITDNIVQMMNGSIKVESKLGYGSTFTLSLPIRINDIDDTKQEDFIGLPILIADDDKDICINTAEMLAEIGMKAFWVLSGEEAVKRAVEAHNRSEDFFAIIIDWIMPNMNGLETVKSLREKLGSQIPIIVISAFDFTDIEEEFVNAGADAFITKPLFKSKVLNVLRIFSEKNKSITADNISFDNNEDMKGKRILLAEDNELNREIATELLKMYGLTVDCAVNGAEAVEIYRNSDSGHYSAILMDIQMPVMDGYTATEIIRKMDKSDSETIPILALTANAFVTDVSKAYSVGMNDHIAKPIDVKHMLSVIRKWIL